MEKVEKIFRNTKIKNHNNEEVLIDNIVNAHIYNTDKQYTIAENIEKICSNEKFVTNASYILNNNFEIIKIKDIKNKIVQDSNNNTLNLKNIASIYNIFPKTTDIIFRTLTINNNTNDLIFVNDILNYVSNCSLYVYDDGNQVFNQEYNNENFVTKFIIHNTANQFNISPNIIQLIVLHYNTLF